MRICIKCNCEMINGFDIKIDGSGYGIKIVKSSSIFSEIIEKPKVSICPKFGEVSLYIEKLNKISSK